MNCIFSQLLLKNRFECRSFELKRRQNEPLGREKKIKQKIKRIETIKSYNNQSHNDVFSFFIVLEFIAPIMEHILDKIDLWNMIKLCVFCSFSKKQNYFIENQNIYNLLYLI